MNRVWSERHVPPLDDGPLFTEEQLQNVGGAVYEKILARIHGPLRGQSFIFRDFLDLTGNYRAASLLLRMSRGGLIRRVAKGCYDGIIAEEKVEEVRRIILTAREPLVKRFYDRIQKLTEKEPVRIIRSRDFTDLRDTRGSREVLQDLVRAGQLVRVSGGKYALPGYRPSVRPRSEDHPEWDFKFNGNSDDLKPVGPVFNTLTNRVIHAINQHAPDWRFYAEDFTHLGKRDSIYWVLAQLTRLGRIKPLKRGLFVRT